MLYSLRIDRELLHIFLSSTNDDNITLLFNPKKMKRVLLKHSTHELELGITSRKVFGEKIFERGLEVNQQPIEFDAILKAVAIQLEQSDINFFRKNRRTYEITYARKIISFLLYKLTPYSHTRIGELIKSNHKRPFHHSTIIYNVSWVKTMYNKEEKLKMDMDSILNILNKKVEIEDDPKKEEVMSQYY